MNPDNTPIFLVFGPNGVGKSTFAAFLVTRGWLHVEIDRFEADDRLPAPWGALCAMRNAWPLSAELRGRMRRGAAKGCVVTFPGGIAPPLELIRAAERAELRIVCLHAPAADCVDAYLERERDSGRNPSRTHWFAHNARCYCQFAQAEYAPYRVATFNERGQPRPNGDLLAQILGRNDYKKPALRTA